MPECGKWFSATLLFLHPPPFFSFSSSISASSSRTSLNFGLSGAGYTLRTVVAFVNDICYCPFFFHICKTIIQDSRFISIIITQPGLNHGADKRLSTYVPRYSSKESSQIAFLFGKESNFNNSSVRAGKNKYDERWMRNSTCTNSCSTLTFTATKDWRRVISLFK